MKSEKNGVSAGFTEASAELFRPNLTEASAEASAEASVSVVHYTKDTKKCNFCFFWKKVRE